MADIVNLTSHYIGSPAPGVYLHELPNASMQVLQDVINATWNEAKGSKADFTAKITAALSGFLDTTTVPHVTTGTVSAPTISEPTVTIPSTQSAGDVIADFNTNRAAIIAELVQKYSDFRTTYFPTEPTCYAAAEQWLTDAIANPDSGLPLAVQQQIFGDDAARILADKIRAQDAVVAQFAARRFPLPPDVAASTVMQIEQKAQDALAESSRKVAMLSVEMQKFSVGTLVGLRGMAMDAATKYMSALASGQDIASKVVGVGYDAQSKLISSAAAFYSARTQAAEVVSKVAQYNNSIQLDADTKNQVADMQMIENKLKALLAEAQSIAQMTTALFNNLHTGVSMSANGGTSISQSNTW